MLSESLSAGVDSPPMRAAIVLNLFGLESHFWYKIVGVTVAHTTLPAQPLSLRGASHWNHPCQWYFKFFQVSALAFFVFVFAFQFHHNEVMINHEIYMRSYKYRGRPAFSHLQI